jgi:hypothetical protein
MLVFKDSDQLYAVLSQLFSEIANNFPDATSAVQDTGIAMRLKFSNPAADILINGKMKPPNIEYNYQNKRADLDVILPAVVFHKILLSELTLKQAFASGKIKIRGPFWKAFSLEPILQAGQLLYPEILVHQEINR